jgi:hypothetical protein
MNIWIEEKFRREFTSKLEDFILMHRDHSGAVLDISTAEAWVAREYFWVLDQEEETARMVLTDVVTLAFPGGLEFRCRLPGLIEAISTAHARACSALH